MRMICSASEHIGILAAFSIIRDRHRPSKTVVESDSNSWITGNQLKQLRFLTLESNLNFQLFQKG
jgi:hypothetical protein